MVAGLVSGVVGGLLVSWLSGSHTSVSGPAAGMVAVVLAQVVALGSYEAFLVAVIMAGVIQILLGPLGEIDHPENARIVHQCVNPAKAVQRCLRPGGGKGGIGRVETRGQNPVRGGKAVCLHHVPQAERDGPAIGQQAVGDRGPQTAPPARNHHHALHQNSP